MKVFGYIVLVIIIIGGLIGLSFGLGWLNVGYKNTVGVASANADRNIFKENKSYDEGMARNLSKLKSELFAEKDKTIRKALVENIEETYANFDSTRLEVPSLREFLEDIQSGKTEKYIDNNGGEN